MKKLRSDREFMLKREKEASSQLELERQSNADAAVIDEMI
jgi:hypothetical protein